MSITSLSSLSDPETPVTRRNLPKLQAFDIYDDKEFIERFRVSKGTVLYLNSEFGDSIKPWTRRNRAIEPIDQILITLRFYASGGYQREIGELFRVEQPTVHRIVHRVTRKIANLKSKYINMPSKEECLDIADDFYNIAGIPRVMGAVDCTHVKINSPGGPQAEMYRNGKGYSLKIQIVCDAKLHIRNIIAKAPGSVHDSTIFDGSPLSTQFEQGDYGNMVLLGDSSYPCRPYLLTPVLNPHTAAEAAYNRSHGTTRDTIERLFSVLKTRFPCLKHGMGFKINNVPPVIVACAVLHNIALEGQDELSDIIISVEDDSAVQLPDSTVIQNFAVRSKLIETNFST